MTLVAEPSDPVSEGLAVVVYLQVLNQDGTMSGSTVETMSCAECGVLLWDVERHWRDEHNNRLGALRAIRARGPE